MKWNREEWIRNSMKRNYYHHWNQTPYLFSQLYPVREDIVLDVDVWSNLTCVYWNPVLIVLLEMTHKRIIWLNVRKGYFISCMTPFGGKNSHIVFCPASLYRWVYYKNPVFKGSRCYYETAEMDDPYISSLFIHVF